MPHEYLAYDTDHQQTPELKQYTPEPSMTIIASDDSTASAPAKDEEQPLPRGEGMEPQLLSKGKQYFPPSSMVDLAFPSWASLTLRHYVASKSECVFR